MIHMESLWQSGSKTSKVSLTVSPSHCLITITQSQCLALSPCRPLSVLLSHCLAISLSHSLTLSLCLDLSFFLVLLCVCSLTTCISLPLLVCIYQLCDCLASVVCLTISGDDACWCRAALSIKHTRSHCDLHPCPFDYRSLRFWTEV